MLVREIVTDTQGNVTERMVEMPDVVTEAEQAVVDAARAAQAATVATNATTLDQQATNALTALRAYRDNATPTTAQTVAVVKVLCRVAIALIRFRLNQLDGTD